MLTGIVYPASLATVHFPDDPLQRVVCIPCLSCVTRMMSSSASSCACLLASCAAASHPHHLDMPARSSSPSHKPAPHVPVASTASFSCRRSSVHRRCIAHVQRCQVADAVRQPLKRLLSHHPRGIVNILVRDRHLPADSRQHHNRHSDNTRFHSIAAQQTVTWRFTSAAKSMTAPLTALPSGCRLPSGCTIQSF